jgi:hypothetical protein
MTYTYGERMDMSEWDIEKLQEKGVLEVWYAYRVDGYEGNGSAIVRTANGWDAFDLSHCSCNDPWYDWNAGNEKATLAEVIASGSAEWQKDFRDLALHFGLAT